jgi:putative sterol carrier protein
LAVFPGQEWLTEFAEAVNSSARYREAAASWEGDISFVIGAEPDKGFPEDVWAWLDLWHGECRAARLVSPEEGSRAAYVIRAPHSRWKDVLRGDLEPIRGMLQGKLKVRGNLPKIILHVRAANELVRLTQTVPTEFVDERAGA